MEVAVRAMAYAAAMFLFGSSMFLIYVPRQALRDAQDAGLGAWRAVRRHVLRLQIGCIVASIVGGVLWFALHTAVISGLPVAQAVMSSAGGAVLHGTLFGRMTALRLIMALAAVALLVPGQRVEVVGALARVDIARATLAGGILATMAWMGHAAATPGVDRYIHLGADVAHLLAAGAWLGSLPPLALMLVRAARAGTPAMSIVAARTTQQFSRVGLVCVGLLLLTGSVNAWYLVGTPAAAFGTRYGQLLLLKLALFALMLVLAASNRLRLLPYIAAMPGPTIGTDSMRRIARNARIEAALGLAIALIVGALGIAIPGAHTEVVWPFPFTINAQALDDHEGLEFLASALLFTGVAAAGVAVIAVRWRRRKLVVVGATVSTVAIVLCGYIFAVPAYPTTYAQSPERYTTASIAAGSVLYMSYCTTCHGADGYGDGPAAASLPVRPANLTAAHASHHRPGEIYWWLTHGIVGTPMPGFADRLTPTQRWQLVNFLRARADAEEARKITGTVATWRPIVAPDFTFEIGRGDQETLEEQRGRDTVLLVLYTFPASEPRLAALAAARTRLARVGIRVVALQCANSPPPETDGIDPTMLAVGDASVATAYALFLRVSTRSQQDCAGGHGEVLVDRDGYLRALRAGLDEPAPDRIAELLLDAERLSREPPHPPPSGAHMH